MLARIQWSSLEDDADPLWGASRGLYVYIAPDDHEILYIGKVDGTTVRQRWNRSGKAGFWDDLERERKILEHSVIFGEIELEEGGRLSRELFADIESLLIARVRPWGNIQSRESRILRPGLRVQCEGAWPLDKRQFYDPR